MASLVAGTLFYLRFGYRFGYSDQDEFIPLAMRLLDNHLFSADWFVLQQSSSFGIRTVFSGLIAFLAWFLSIQGAVLAVHLATWVALTVALYRLCFKLYSNDLVAFVFVCAAAVVTARWNPGGNDIFHAMLVPSSLGWALGLWSIDRVLHQKYLFAGILMGSAMLIHPIVGLQLGGLILVILLLRDPKALIAFSLPFLCVAGVSILVFQDQGTAHVGDFSSSYILTVLRAPHHYLPASFSGASWVKWCLLLIPGSIVLWKNHLIPGNIGTENRATRNFFFSSLLIAIAVLGLALILIRTTSGSVVDLLIRLQPFNLAVWVRILALLGCSALVVGLLPAALRTHIERWIHGRFSGQVLVLGCAAALIIGAVVFNRPFHVMSPPAGEVLDAETAEWVRNNTPIDAVFVIPPAMSGFQTGAKRAQYVNFKAFPFESLASSQWLDRLQHIAPLDQLEPGGTSLLSRFQQSYVLRLPAHFIGNPDLTGVSYIVRPRDSSREWDENLTEWCSPDWCIFATDRLSFLSQ